MSDFSRIGTNSGHGHAWPRPDGVKARCGGTVLCRECAADKALVAEAMASAIPLTDPANNPIRVDIGKNPAMDCFDIMIQIGNFRTEADARMAGRRIVEILQTEFGAGPNMIQ